MIAFLYMVVIGGLYYGLTGNYLPLLDGIFTPSFDETHRLSALFVGEFVLEAIIFFIWLYHNDKKRRKSGLL